MNETIFGSLSTPEKRIAYLQAQTAGFTHNSRLQPIAPGSGDAPLLTATVALPERIARVECVLLLPETAVLPLTPGPVEWDLLNWTYRQTWQATLPPRPAGTLVRYRLRAIPAGGGAPLWADGGATFSYLVNDDPPPAWARQAIVYQVFPDRFHPGNGRVWNDTSHLSDIFGGTLRGVIDQLDYVAGMGFNTLWLNPFFPDKTHHGYHATDHFSVNPRLGSMADMDTLIAAAHARGIRLLLDFVGNHVGSDHPHFQHALAHRDSPYHDWFMWRRWPDDYVAYYEVRELPELNTENPAVRAYLFDSVRFWLDKGFDGLRIDYTLGPTLDFWTALRAAVRETAPHTWLFGETVHVPPTLLLYDGRFHGNLDFLLAQALRDTFGFNTMDVVTFDAFLQQHETFFPPYFIRPSFIDNHDMNRFLWIAGGDTRKLKLALLCQFTLRHPPVVYNGTEVGVTQVRDIGAADSHGLEECRQPMRWGDAQDADVREFVRHLAQFRQAHPALRDGRRTTLHADRAGAYAYVVADEHEAVLVAFNLSDESRAFEMEMPGNGRRHTLRLGPWAGFLESVEQ